MNFEKSSIERLKRTLYSRDEKVVPKEKRSHVEGEEPQVPPNWGEKPSFDMPLQIPAPNNSFFNKFLVGSLVFFGLSLSVALFIFFGGFNTISSNNVDVEIVAPTSVSSGEELLTSVSVVNGNQTDLEEVILFINYPEGAQQIDVTGKKLSRQKIELGTVGKGQFKEHTFRAVLFGEKDAVKSFVFRVEYKVKGSNATFSKEKTYDIFIGSSPIFLNVKYPAEINSGEKLSLFIEITSNSIVPIKNMLIKVEYPYGFTYKDSNIEPFRDNSIWNMGDLKNGDKKTLSISGTLVGQNMEDRSFRILAGMQTTDASKDFDTALATAEATVGIRKSFFDLRLHSSNGEVLTTAQSVPMAIQWQNTLPDKITNAHITVTMSGNVFDRASVLAGEGLYSSLDSTIVWDKNTTDSLKDISPGEESQVLFSFAPFSNPTQVRSIKNPYLEARVVMTGERSGTETATISSSANITIKISSALSIISQSHRDSGPFGNTGPIPPRADKESTYTVTWVLSNTVNDLKAVIVSATLPPSVVWKEEHSPAGEKIIYNPDTRVISWNAGNVSSGVGFAYAPRMVSFKVGITPNITEVGVVPKLLSETSAIATDTYAEISLTASAQPVTTHYSDTSFRSGNDIVVK